MFTYVHTYIHIFFNFYYFSVYKIFDEFVTAICFKEIIFLFNFDYLIIFIIEIELKTSIICFQL